IADEKQRLELLLSGYHNKYIELLNTVSTMRLASSGVISDLSVIEPAYPNSAPIRPRLLLNVLLAALVSALIGAGGAFGIELFDDTVKSATDIERLTGLVPLASIGNMRGSASDKKLVAASRSNQPLAEDYRHLRTKLEICAETRSIST